MPEPVPETRIPPEALRVDLYLTPWCPALEAAVKAELDALLVRHMKAFKLDAAGFQLSTPEGESPIDKPAQP